jgi:uncharacterized tellurite resistance protein B-like protein
MLCRRIKGIDAVMSDADSLQNRGRSLENAFFSNLDEELLSKLREKLSVDNAVAEFQTATGIKDPNVVAALHKLGISPSTMSAMRVLPLIAVAWADGQADANEIAAVNTIASRHFQHDSAAAGLLKNWLSNRPTEAMLDAWEAYAATVFASLSEGESQSLKAALIEEVNEVATASGGLLGFGAVSASEEKTIVRIKRALGVAG